MPITRVIFILALIICTLTACPSNCYECDAQGSVCFICSQGFELNVLGTCVDQNIVPNCNLFGPSNQCFACQPTFKFNPETQACQKQYSACSTFDPSDDTVCEECGFGTVLQRGVCAGAINCNTAQAACTACATGFRLNANKCADNTGNCKDINTNGVCKTCKNGFKLVGYICIRETVTAYGCYIFNDAGVCSLCKSGLNIFQGNCFSPNEINQIENGIIKMQQLLNTRSSTVSVTTTQTVVTTTTTAADNAGSSNFNNDFGDDGGFSFNGGSSSIKATTTTQGGSSTKPTVQTITIAFCAEQSGNICLRCNQGYYFAINQCVLIPANCATPDSARKNACLACDGGYSLSNGNCFQNIVFCAEQSGNNCLRCNQGYYFAINQCVTIPANCATPDSARKNSCLACNGGFSLSNGICFQNIVFCAQQNGANCLRCNQGYYFALSQCLIMPTNCITPDTSRRNYCLTCAVGFTLNNGNCLQTISPNTPNCQSYNLLSGLCIACFPNYVLSNNQCVFSQPNGSGTSGSTSTTTTTTSTTSGSSGSSSTGSGGAITISTAARDPNCAKYDRNICSACSTRYYFGLNGLCIPINPLCKDFNTSGACTSCYQGYNLSGNQCIVSRQVDSFCKQYTAGVCSSCYAGYFYSRSKVLCQPFNPLCKTSNITDGTCRSCFPGYRLVAQNGTCSVAPQDPNCKSFNAATSNCIECSTKFFLNPAGRCIQVNTLCNTSDPTDGRCLSCFPGYVLNARSLCIVAEESTSDINCQTFVNNVCTRCYNSYFLNSRKLCVLSNPLCKTSDQNNGACISCYPGYVVLNGNCSVAAVSGGDPNCKKDDNNGNCIQCYFGYFVTNRKCTKIQLNCKTSTADGRGCLDCWGGYALVNNICILQKQSPNLNNDLNCIKSQGAACLTCAAGYYLSSVGVCNQQNTLCRTIDRSNGACTSCYPGYVVSGTTCIVAAPFEIANCINVYGDRCLQCNNGYYVKNNVCEVVSITCATYDMKDGLCTSCIPGHFYQERQCIYPSLGVDPSCVYYTNSFCSRCNNRSVLIQFVCRDIDPDCNQFDEVRGICTSCARGKRPSGINCI